MRGFVHAGAGTMVAGMLMLSGCGHQEPLGEVDLFEPEDQPRHVDYIAAAQAARGAVDDAMLYPHHFDGGQLNTLGASKLHLMMSAAPDHAPMRVHLVLREDDELADQRRTAVLSFAGERGWTEERLDVAPGANPHRGSAARPGILSLERLQTGDLGGQITRE